VLTEAVRRRPYQVVLFDEVEKAHPDVFNVLLQVLDDGRLTDGQGRVVDFKQTLIILTSNLGARALSELPEGADASAAKAEVMEAVRAHFRPEFLNRLDEQIIFDRLNRADMAGIVEIQLKRLEQRLAARKITLDLDADAKAWLADEGYDPVFGARPLKRVIQRQLQDPLAEMLLAGEVLDGTTIRVTAGPEGLIIGERVVASRRTRPSEAVVPLTPPSGPAGRGRSSMTLSLLAGRSVEQAQSKAEVPLCNRWLRPGRRRPAARAGRTRPVHGRGLRPTSCGPSW
jgi:ATP-dependent Clp protease ATP-binding subunit ClpB